MIAVFYKKEEYGLLELFRKDIPSHAPIYMFPVKDPANSAIAVFDASVTLAQATTHQITFERIGQLPTGELMYLGK